jgi:hypothetical protein
MNRLFTITCHHTLVNTDLNSVGMLVIVINNVAIAVAIFELDKEIKAIFAIEWEVDLKLGIS